MLLRRFWLILSSDDTIFHTYNFSSNLFYHNLKWKSIDADGFEGGLMAFLTETLSGFSWIYFNDRDFIPNIMRTKASKFLELSTSSNRRWETSYQFIEIWYSNSFQFFNTSSRGFIVVIHFTYLHTFPWLKIPKAYISFLSWITFLLIP